MAKIYKVEPAEQRFSITWNIGPRCNYDCMYCPTMLHDNHSTHPSLDLLKKRWLSIYEKTYQQNLLYKLSFTGGEVSANKSSLPLFEWLTENYGHCIDKILVTTNGSASLAYYKKMFKIVNNMSFSLHSEHVHETKFFDTVISLKKTLPGDRHLHVSIMDEFWNQARIPEYVKILQTHGISCQVNKIDYSKQTRTIPIMKGKLDLEI